MGTMETTTGARTGQACKSDDDCFTSCDLKEDGTGTCVVPFDNPSPYVLECLLQGMDGNVKNALMRSLAIYDPNDLTTFTTEFSKRFNSTFILPSIRNLVNYLAYRCSGPSGFKVIDNHCKIEMMKQKLANQLFASIEKSTFCIYREINFLHLSRNYF
jgi:hypothetical protein